MPPHSIRNHEQVASEAWTAFQNGAKEDKDLVEARSSRAQARQSRVDPDASTFLDDVNASTAPSMKAITSMTIPQLIFQHLSLSSEPLLRKLASPFLACMKRVTHLAMASQPMTREHQQAEDARTLQATEAGRSMLLHKGGFTDSQVRKIQIILANGSPADPVHLKLDWPPSVANADGRVLSAECLTMDKLNAALPNDLSGLSVRDRNPIIRPYPKSDNTTPYIRDDRLQIYQPDGTYDPTPNQCLDTFFVHESQKQFADGEAPNLGDSVSIVFRKEAKKAVKQRRKRFPLAEGWKQTSFDLPFCVDGQARVMLPVVIVYSEHDKTVHHVDVYTWHPSAFRPSNGKTELSIAHAGVHDAVLSFVSGLLTGKSTSSTVMKNHINSLPLRPALLFFEVNHLARLELEEGSIFTIDLIPQAIRDYVRKGMSATEKELARGYRAEKDGSIITILRLFQLACGRAGADTRLESNRKLSLTDLPYPSGNRNKLRPYLISKVVGLLNDAKPIGLGSPHNNFFPGWQLDGTWKNYDRRMPDSLNLARTFIFPPPLDKCLFKGFEIVGKKDLQTLAGMFDAGLIQLANSAGIVVMTKAEHKRLQGNEGRQGVWGYYQDSESRLPVSEYASDWPSPSSNNNGLPLDISPWSIVPSSTSGPGSSSKPSSSEPSSFETHQWTAFFASASKASTPLLASAPSVSRTLASASKHRRSDDPEAGGSSKRVRATEKGKQASTEDDEEIVVVGQTSSGSRRDLISSD